MTPLLFLITDLHIGGTEKIVFETATRLDKAKYRPFVVCLKKKGAYAARIEAQGIPVRSLDLHSHPLLVPFKLLFALSSLAVFVKREKIAVIHSFLFQANMLGKALGLVCGVPVITSVRVMEEEKRWQFVFERISRHFSWAVVVNSQALKDFTAQNTGIPSAKIEVVYNGVDPDACAPPDRSLFNAGSNDIVAFTAARLHEQKGIRCLIEAAKLLCRENSALRFFVAGDGPERGTLESLAGSPELSGRFVFLGWREDVPALLASSDIFVLPSLWEGTPNTILEAMACGKAIIATMVGGVPELLEDGRTGMLVPPGNPDELADKIRQASQDAALRGKMGALAREKARARFSLPAMVTRFERLYDAAIKNDENERNRL